MANRTDGNIHPQIDATTQTHRSIAAGIVLNPSNNRFQLWVTTDNGKTFDCLSAHKRKYRVAADLDELRLAAARGDLSCIAKINQLITRFTQNSDRQLCPLPMMVKAKLRRNLASYWIETYSL